MSDTSSFAGYQTLASPPSNVVPRPAYIAASAASQIVTSDQQVRFGEWFSEQALQTRQEGVLVSPGSLSLVNAFLDHLLWNFLAKAKSTTLASLRPAVAEVLQKRLAKEAIEGADEELSEFLGVGEDEELSDFHGGQEPRGDWDLELVWKRTRLRCMVYTRLGDMEEDEEDEYVRREDLDGPVEGRRRFSSQMGAVSPAVAIFLTSVLEFVGEHALMVAGEAAHTRIDMARKRSEHGLPYDLTNNMPERLVVGEDDMAKAAFDNTLSRLWRSWRKQLKSPSVSRPLSQGRSAYRSPASRKGSTAVPTDLPKEPIPTEEAELDPATVPLPTNEYDVAEIQMAGFASGEEDLVREDSEDARSKRPMSMAGPAYSGLPTPISPSSGWQPAREAQVYEKPAFRRMRSNSLPTPVRTPYRASLDEDQLSTAFATPMEFPDPTREDAYDAEEASDKHEGPSDQGMEYEEDGASNRRGVAEVVGAGLVSGTAAAVASRAMTDDSTTSTPRQSTAYTHEEGDRERLGQPREEVPPVPRKSPVRAMPDAKNRISVLGGNNVYDFATSMQGVQDHPPLDANEREVPPSAKDMDEDRYIQSSVPAPIDTNQVDFGHEKNHTLPSEYSVERDVPTEEERYGEKYGAGDVSPAETERNISETAAALEGKTRRSESGNRTFFADEPQSPTNETQSARSTSSGSKYTNKHHVSGGSQTWTAAPRQNSSVPEPPILERAAVQRITPPPLTPLDTSSTRRSASVSSSHKRPIHTSASSTSSRLKGFMGKHSDGRSSSDMHRVVTDDPSTPADKFEQLIQSDETLQYTLTPQNMRKMDVSYVTS